MKQTGTAKNGLRIFENRYIEISPEQKNPLGGIARPGRYRDVSGQVALYKHRQRMEARQAARAAKLAEPVEVGDAPEDEIVQNV